MNPIELEWQHITKDELAGQMFEDELELAYAVMNGVEAREKKETTLQNALNLAPSAPLNLL